MDQLAFKYCGAACEQYTGNRMQWQSSSTCPMHVQVSHFLQNLRFVASGEVKAFGIESVQLPFLPDSTGAAEAAKSKLEKAAAEFEKSDFLKGLKERSEQNKEKYDPDTNCSQWYECFVSKFLPIIKHGPAEQSISMSPAFLAGTRRKCETSTATVRQKWELVM